jgi:hypothetical protein
LLPRRRKRERMAHKDASVIRCPGHLQFVRGFQCSVENERCGGTIQAAHVRIGGNAGMGIKPGDDRTIPLCGIHHAEQHAIGETSFEARYGISMAEIAAKIWAKSKPADRYRARQESP